MIKFHILIKYPRDHKKKRFFFFHSLKAIHLIGLIQLSFRFLVHCPIIIIIVPKQWLTVIKWIVQSNQVQEIKVYKGCWTARIETASDTLTQTFYLSLLEYNKHSYKVQKYVIVDSLATGWSHPIPDFSKRRWREMYI